MRKSLVIVTMCCALALAAGLVGCGGSSSGGSGSPAPSAPEKIEVLDEYLDIDGGGVDGVIKTWRS